MARDLIIHMTCDLCGDEAVHVGVPITIGRTGPRTLDFCVRHYKEFIQPVLDALADHGLDPDSSAPPRPGWRQGRNRKIGPFRCLAGCQAAPLKSASTLTQHLRLIHDGMTLEEYTEKYGELVPLTREEQVEMVLEVRCEVEGCNKVYSTALGNRWPDRAMVSHMWGRHGIKWRPVKG